ncbi:MAG: hypothetical protein ACQKBY_11275 [Verrucomicrobiales bacterium]
MKYRIWLTLALAALASCQKKEQVVVVDEQRERTLFDEQRPLNIVDRPPSSWRQIPSTQFRKINYLAGPEEKVEIFVGQAGGGVEANATRWLGQFGKPAVESLSELTELPIMDTRGYLLEAQGDYEPGMGRPPAKDQAMFGALIPTGDGVLTIKMVGPAASVEAQREDFLNYCKTMALSDVTRIQRPKPDADNE